MRFALIPLQINPRYPADNVTRLADSVAAAVQRQPDVICLPECTLTGYVYEVADVRRAAEPIPGPTTARIAQLAKTHNVHICFGMVEASEDRFYNVAVMLNQAGEIVAVHRKIQEMPPFATGDMLTTVTLDTTRIGVIVCGDLFHASIIMQRKTTLPALDTLLVPMARCFDGPSPDMARWQKRERQLYLDAVRDMGIPTLIVNGLYDDYFGGALVISSTGELLGESPHGTDQHLVWDGAV